MIDVLRMLWNTGSAELHGEHFDFPRVHAQPTPGHPIPLYVGGHSDAAIRRAAECDGWMGLDFAMDEIPAVVAKIREARRAAGKGSEPFEIFLSPREAVAPDTYERLEDMGVTAVLLPSWALLDGDFTSLDAKRRQMEGFAKTYLS
jgi:alkanesulfonate monooxygenase SsuD/methylene tetrahydromethanopterin reductase-like flavin-dependent oxidoreductase (luciferase family)